MPRRNTNQGVVVRHSGSDNCNLNKVFRHSLTEATTEQRPSRKAGGVVSLGVGGVGSFPDGWHSKCDAPEAGPCYSCSGSARQRGEEWGQGQRGVSASPAFTP